MDIFTTALTRFIPTPIKPASLKVKALLKDAGAGKLKEDLDHLENHDHYFGTDKDKNKHKDGEQDKNSGNKKSESTYTSTLNTELKPSDENHLDKSDSVVTESEDGVKHLDLYV